MKRILVSICAAILALNCLADTHLPKSKDYRNDDPAVKSLLQAIRKVDSTGELNSVMVLKNGEKVVEYYDVCYGPDFLNICWSASKTFTATAIGFAVQEGRLSLDDRLVEHLKAEQLPSQVSDTLSKVTLRHLITMSSGIKNDLIGPLGARVPGIGVRSTLEKGFRFYPGTQYKYNSFNTYLLSVVLTNVTGEKVVDYLKPRLFKPLGITRYHWDESLEGYSMGGWGLYITSESLAKMGQFFLQKGVWKGKRLLNAKWIEEAMSPQVMQYHGKNWTDAQIAAAASDDKNCGYGYQMWCNSKGGARLDGAHGQWSFILPKDNAVIVVTGNCRNTSAEMKAIWETVYTLVKE